MIFPMAFATKRMVKIAIFAAVAIALTIAPVSALEPPRVIPHSASIDKPLPDLFKILKSYFSDRLESKFELIGADEKAGTIVAKQNGIDSDRWRQWAACQTDPMHMIYQLNDAAVTLTIKLEKAARNTTFMTVSADFKGEYGLAQDVTTLECRSTGVLEDNILAFAGARMTGASAPKASAP